jgi:hypothetical protein
MSFNQCVGYSVPGRDNASSLMRTAKFGKLPNLPGSAEFTIVYVPGKIESVEYVSGEGSLKALIEKIKAAHYQVEFPAGSQAKLLRRAELSCLPLPGCMAVLMPTDKAQVRQNQVGQNSDKAMSSTRTQRLACEFSFPSVGPAA